MQISILIILLLILTYELILLRRNKGINKVLTLFIIVAVFQWYYLPILLTILGANAVVDLINGNNLHDLYSLMIKEVIFLQIILGLLILSENGRRIRLSSFKIVENSKINSERTLFFVSTILILAQIIYMLIFKMDYTINNDINEQQGGGFQIVSIFVNFFISYFWIYFIYDSKRSKVKTILVVLLISLYSLTMILSGSRIYFLGFLFLLLISVIKTKSIFSKLRKYVTLVAVLTISLIMLPILASKRLGQSGDSSTISTTIRLIPEQLNIKLNSFSYSDVLLKYDGPGFAGFNPYIGSVMKFVPRFIWKDKPTATSFNSGVDGIPARRIPYLQGVKSDSYNVGVSAFAVSLWQMGYFTVIIAIIINLLFLKYISRALNNDSLIIKSIGFMLMGFPQLVMIPTYGDNIIQNMELAFIIILILLLFKILKFAKNENSSI